MRNIEKENGAETSRPKWVVQMSWTLWYAFTITEATGRRVNCRTSGHSFVGRGDSGASEETDRDGKGDDRERGRHVGTDVPIFPPEIDGDRNGERKGTSCRLLARQ